MSNTDAPHIDAVIVSLCAACNMENAAEQAKMFEASLNRSGYGIAALALLASPAGGEKGWQPMATEPNDGKFRFYGLYVNHDGLGEIFEAHYIALDEDGQLILPGGDNFDDWHFTDFEVWCDAPAAPPAMPSTATLPQDE